MNSNEICTRFAPSPSGAPHAGNIRTALMSWLWAKRNNGKFILRIESSNLETTSDESIKAIFDTLDWLGIKSDVPVVYQHERGEIYKEYIQKLLDTGFAYKCYCTKEMLEEKRQAQLENKQKPIYDGTCRNKTEPEDKPYTVRFKIPENKVIEFEDIILGKISVHSSELTDFIICRENGDATFLLVNMIDDYLQGVTCVLRGADGVNHAWNQVELYKALGAPVPTFGHLPFVVNEQGAKLSKRGGDPSVLDLKAMGYLPQAVINALIRVGWSFGDREVFTVEELKEKFDLNNVGKSAGVFDMSKLLHLNSVHIKNTPIEELTQLCIPFFNQAGYNTDDLQHTQKIVQSLQSRSKTLVEMADMARFYYQQPTLNPENSWTDTELTALVLLKQKLQEISFTPETVEAAVKEVCAQLGIKLKQVGNAFRLSLTGSEQAPSIYEIIHILGKAEVDTRLQAAINLGA